MSLTSTQITELLGLTTASTQITQIEKLLPLISVQVNDYCNGGFSRQVKEESVTFTSTTTKQLDNYPVVKGSVVVSSTARDEYYYGDTQFGHIPDPCYYIPSTYIRDYEVSYTTGGLSIMSTDSQIGSTESVYVTYAYVDIVDGGAVAVANLIKQTIDASPGVAAESVGTLSRSYYSGGYDPVIKSLLSPYKRPRVV